VAASTAKQQMRGDGREPDAVALPYHGAADLPHVHVDSYNLELRDAEGFVGDKASGRAFRKLLEDIRRDAKGAADMASTRDMSKSELDAILTGDNLGAAAIVQGAIEEFAQNLANVAQRFLRQHSWKGVERIVVGGGLRRSRVGEIAILRAATLLRQADFDVDVVPLSHHPDEAGLLGGLQLLAPEVMRDHDGFVAIDIGGTNIRCGIVTIRRKDQLGDTAKVERLLHWRHRDEKLGREAVLDHLGGMMRELSDRAEKKKLRLAPVIAVGCPGVIAGDGWIKRGAQNLPGNWEGEDFNLTEALHERMPRIGGRSISVALHNDAVVQGLSEVFRMRDVKRWAALTIGTGLGNASYTNVKGEE
jgi:predicted NBD/HSP70 family sugar kinase